MDRNISLVFVLLFLTASGTIIIQPVKASSKTIVVPDDYLTIQAAIDSANSGDTVFVKAGIYPETLVISKSISLIGEDRNSTIIDAQKVHAQVILINSSDIIVANFTLGNSGFHQLVSSGDGYVNGEGNGIKASDAIFSPPFQTNNTKIINNTIIDCPFTAVDLEPFSANNLVVGNIIVNCGVGIKIGCLDSIIENNTFANTPDGIKFFSKSVQFLFSPDGGQVSFTPSAPAGDYNGQLSPIIYFNESNTIEGNQDITLTTIPTPFPSPTSTPTSNPVFTVSLSESASALNYGNTINFTVSTDGGTPPYTYAWYVDGQLSETNASSYFSTDTLPVGSHHVYVQVNDANGNSATTLTVSFEVLPTSSPSPSIPEFPSWIWIILPLAAVTTLSAAIGARKKKSQTLFL